MKTLAVFDPAMCCSTGVCGVDVDPVLAQFAADLQWVAAQGVAVSRHNLGQDPQAFAANSAVLKEMEAGIDRLPVIVIDGAIASTGMYPSRVQLAKKLGLAVNAVEPAAAACYAPTAVDAAAGAKSAAPASCCSPKSGCC
jgi:hypothetical protein